MLNKTLRVILILMGILSFIGLLVSILIRDPLGIKAGLIFIFGCFLLYTILKRTSIDNSKKVSTGINSTKIVINDNYYSNEDKKKIMLSDKARKKAINIGSIVGIIIIPLFWVLFYQFYSENQWYIVFHNILFSLSVIARYYVVVLIFLFYSVKLYYKKSHEERPLYFPKNIYDVRSWLELFDFIYEFIYSIFFGLYFTHLFYFYKIGFL